MSLCPQILTPAAFPGKRETYDDLPLMLSVQDVAKVLGISRAGAYDLAHSKKFPSMKIGSRIIVPKDKFLLWIEKQCGEG